MATIEYVGTVKSIEDREDLTFTNTDYEVEHIAESLGLEPGEFGAFFVGGTETGDYTEAYGIEGIIPGLHKALYRVIPEIHSVRR